MAKVKKFITHLSCTECFSKNYSQLLNNKNRKIGSLALKKFCQSKKCRKHTKHTETK